MKKRSLLVVIALLCMASLMASMAYTTASTRNTAAFTTTNTNQALLAITASDHHAAAGYDSSGSQHLVIDWSKGKGNASYGVQEGSIYTWDNLFFITNNNERDVKVRVYVDEKTANDNGNTNSDVYLRKDGVEAWTGVANANKTFYKNAVEFTLKPGEMVGIDSKIDSNSSLKSTNITNGTRGIEIMVDAEEVVPE